MLNLWPLVKTSVATERWVGLLYEPHPHAGLLAEQLRMAPTPSNRAWIAKGQRQLAPEEPGALTELWKAHFKCAITRLL